MEPYIESYNLVDLISDKHAKLRKMVIDAWIKNGEEEITDTESYMIAIVQKERTTVAQIAKKIGISRQGAHKCAKGLIEKGYIEIENRERDSSDKGLAEKYLRESYFLATARGDRKSSEIYKRAYEDKFQMIL